MVREPFRLGAYAVVTARSAGTEHMLLVPKVEGPYLGRLDLPGGGVDPFEDPDDTLVRELREECGLVVEPEQTPLFAVRSVVFRYTDADGTPALLHHVGVLSRISYDEMPHVTPEPGEADPEWIDPARAGQYHLTPFAWWAARQLAGG
jgi:8-oxo-dGTP pyrophosphatase MutT (NUDIX family)